MCKGMGCDNICGKFHGARFLMLVEDYARQYALVFIFTVLAFVVPLSMLVMSKMLEMLSIRPRKPSSVKQELYECGMVAVGGRWRQFNFKYYVYAILFLIFDVEAVFLFPWAVRFNKLGLYALVEMFAFILILVAGWLYAWRKGDLEWR